LDVIEDKECVNMQLSTLIRVQPAGVFSKIFLINRMLIGILVLSSVVSCGRADTSANTIETLAPVATTTTDAYPINTPTIATSLTPEVIAIDYPPSELGIVVDASMTVLHVEAGGAADQAGIRPGDKLLTVDDIPVASDISKVKRLVHQTNGTPVRVKVVRGTQEIELKVQPGIRPARTTTPTPVVSPNDYL
jgi:S1-C subfamily serine protease